MKRTGPREMRPKELHLISQDAATLEEDVFRVIRRERDGQQLHARLFRRAARLVVVAALAGGDHVVPVVAAAAAQGSDMLAGELAGGKALAAVHAHVGVALEQGMVVERRHVVLARLGEIGRASCRERVSYHV